MNAIDTNVWLYCYDDRDPRKRERARELALSVEPLVLLWQIGCEFIAAARKLEPFGFTLAQAWTALAKIEALSDRVSFPDREIWPLAQSLQQRFSLHFWDALLVAGCIRSGVKTLYSEDLQHGIEMGGVTVVNPFESIGDAHER